MDRIQKIQNNLEVIKSDILSFKTQKHVDLVAVTKYGDYSDVEIMYNLGHRDFGENRVEELVRKQNEAVLRSHNDIRWHFLGQIQSGKINDLLSVKNLVAIHSISQFSHVKKISNKLSELNRSLDFYLQINTSHEDEKNGLESKEEVLEFLSLLNELGSSHFSLIGLMTMGKIRSSDMEKDAKICFRALAQLKNELGLVLKLSMGMSNDYKIALVEGADCIRIGSVLFK